MSSTSPAAGSITVSTSRGRVTEVWGGLAAMLVAMPSAIAYGLVATAPLGGTLAAAGALAGIVGAAIIGLIAPPLGGTPRLVSAPCAPAAAVLATVSTQALANGVSAADTLVALSVVALMAGLMQLGFAALKGGRLIKYIPYPVVAGYLSGVGVLIFIGQLPKAMGWPRGAAPWATLTSPSAWEMTSILVAAITATAMVLAPRITRAFPAPILALSAGTITYGILAHLDPALARLENNVFVVGPIGDLGLGAIVGQLGERLSAFGRLQAFELVALLGPAATLAVLLSVDTLKTCVVIDAMTRSRHDSNRELRGQGVANVCSALFGGMPGAGTMGATLVNLHSGGKTRLSATAAGGFSLLAVVALSPLVSWIPIAALAGILLVVAVRMIDTHVLSLAKDRSTLLDFAVICAVVVTAVMMNLLAAAGVGVALAILLFLREQIRGSVVRRRLSLGHRLSKKRRLPNEVTILEAHADETVALELQGSLFFGTADQLFGELGADLHRRRFVILDLRRVMSVDFTAVRMLEQIAGHLHDHGGQLVLANVPLALPSGQDLATYLEHTGATQLQNLKLVAALDDALAWCEDETLRANAPPRGGLDKPLELSEIMLFRDAEAASLTALLPLLKERTFERNEVVFRARDAGDELCFIRRGFVRIQLALANDRVLHLATFGPGDHFGELAFIDHQTRSAEAVARTEVVLFTLSRAEFDQAVKIHPQLSTLVLGELARSLALRLRHADRELQAAEES
jgi:sulfate permease, SulP family